MHTHKKGFIALIFVLGMATLLLAAMSMGSQNVFDFIRVREDFKAVHKKVAGPILCADGYVDILVRTMHLEKPETYDYAFEEIPCHISSISMVRESVDTVHFSFASGELKVEGIMVRGLISELKTL